jgi:hypothetical protein
MRSRWKAKLPGACRAAALLCAVVLTVSCAGAGSGAGEDYPEVIWLPGVSPQGGISNPDNRYDYGGLTFEATLGTESCRFGFVSVALPATGYLHYFVMPVDTNGDGTLSPGENGQMFEGHTVHVTLTYSQGGSDLSRADSFVVDVSETLWRDQSWIDPGGIDYANVDGFADYGLDADGQSYLKDDYSGSYSGPEDYPLAAFAEIRLVAPDGTTYYGWTNPDL